MEKSEQNAGIFATYPRSGISMPQGPFIVIFGSKYLQIQILSDKGYAKIYWEQSQMSTNDHFEL